jgi:hypothetical protein
VTVQEVAVWGRPGNPVSQSPVPDGGVVRAAPRGGAPDVRVVAHGQRVVDEALRVAGTGLLVELGVLAEHQSLLTHVASHGCEQRQSFLGLSRQDEHVTAVALGDEAVPDHLEPVVTQPAQVGVPFRMVPEHRRAEKVLHCSPPA